MAVIQETTHVHRMTTAIQRTFKRFETVGGFLGPIRPGDTTMEIVDAYDAEVKLTKASDVRVEAENAKEEDPRIERVKFVADGLPDGVDYVSFKPKVTDTVEEEHGAVAVESDETRPAKLSHSKLNAVRKARELLLDGEDVIVSAPVREGVGETQDGEEYRFVFIDSDMADAIQVTPADDGDGD